jgi:hypothetical protein
MSLRDKLIGTKDDRAEYKAAKKELRGDTYPSDSDPTYLKRNDRVLDAEKNIPWLGRG